MLFSCGFNWDGQDLSLGLGLHARHPDTVRFYFNPFQKLVLFVFKVYGNGWVNSHFLSWTPIRTGSGSGSPILIQGLLESLVSTVLFPTTSEWSALSSLHRVWAFPLLTVTNDFTHLVLVVCFSPAEITARD